jgi:hypothetical protein
MQAVIAAVNDRAMAELAADPHSYSALTEQFANPLSQLYGSHHVISYTRS